MMPVRLMSEIDTYRISIDGIDITVRVVDVPAMVSTGITELRRGLGAYSAIGIVLRYHAQEWRPSHNNCNPAMLQLCVGTRCLMIQLCRLSGIPKCLNEFLADPENCFVGLNAGSISDLKYSHYGLEIKNFIGVDELAVKKLKKPDLQGLELKAIAAEVGYSLDESPDTVEDIDWGAKVYSDKQIKRAVHDVYAARLVGTKLLWMP